MPGNSALKVNDLLNLFRIVALANGGVTLVPKVIANLFETRPTFYFPFQRMQYHVRVQLVISERLAGVNED